MEPSGWLLVAWACPVDAPEPHPLIASGLVPGRQHQ